MYQVMIDLETLGLDDNAVIVQIAFVIFDPNFNIINELDIKLDVTMSLLDGFEADRNTAHKFWAKQDKKVIEEVFFSQPRLAPRNAAQLIDKWLKSAIGDQQFAIWANGILFDVPKIDGFMNRYGFKPITARTRYNLVYDLRSIMATGKQLHPEAMEAAKKLHNQGSLHNALHDCYYQINMLKSTMDCLGRKVEADFELEDMIEAPATASVSELVETGQLVKPEVLTEEKAWEDEVEQPDPFLMHVYGRTGKDS